VALSASGEQVYELLVSYRSGDMWAPRLDNSEGLRREALHFVDCIQNNKTPDTDGLAGLRVVRLLEAAEQSLAARGTLIEVEDAQA
jgi:predicted dehydrogenase